MRHEPQQRGNAGARLLSGGGPRQDHSEEAVPPHRGIREPQPDGGPRQDLAWGRFLHD